MEDTPFETFCDECGDPIGLRPAIYAGNGRFLHYECEVKRATREEEKIRDSILRRQKRRNRNSG